MKIGTNYTVVKHGIYLVHTLKNLFAESSNKGYYSKPTSVLNYMYCNICLIQLREWNVDLDGTKCQDEQYNMLNLWNIVSKCLMVVWIIPVSM